MLVEKVAALSPQIHSEMVSQISNNVLFLLTGPSERGRSTQPCLDKALYDAGGSLGAGGHSGSDLGIELE